MGFGWSSSQEEYLRLKLSISSFTVETLRYCRTPVVKNYDDKKHQQNDSQILFDSQENVFQAISAVLTQSSQSTNVGEMEETLLQRMDTENCADVEESTQSLPYSLRSRTLAKRLESESSRSFSRGQNCPGSCKSDRTCPGCWDAEQHSQESVSMLQGCYGKSPDEFPELMETCLNSEPEEIDIYSDEDIGKTIENANTDSPCRGSVEMVENSTQTDSFCSRGESSEEKEMIKHANFISSIVRLKTALSSKKTISDKKLKDIIHGGKEEEYRSAEETDSESHSESVPKETIDYLLRSSDIENVCCETVQALLQHLETTLRGDFTKVAFCWKNSVHETAVEVLIHAVDSEIGVENMVDRFLCRIIESVLNNKDKSKNLTLESKTNFVMSFCRSAHLSCTAVNFIIERLKMLKIIERHNERISLTEKCSWASFIKNSYYLLRILHSSLELLKAKIQGGKTENVVKRSDKQYYNVLQMWKKHWSGDEEASREKKSDHEWEITVSEWNRELDEILLHCVSHVPILSMMVERCGESAKEILKSCHPDLMEDRTKTAPPAEKWADN